MPAERRGLFLEPAAEPQPLVLYRLVVALHVVELHRELQFRRDQPAGRRRQDELLKRCIVLGANQLGTWNLVAGQSVNLTLSPARATFTGTQVTTTPMHVGDICNLGIFCVDPTSNRNLLDFNMETIDPKTGCAHIAFADDNTVNMLRVANQTAGCIRPS